MAALGPWKRTGRKAGADHLAGLASGELVEIVVYDDRGAQQGTIVAELLRRDEASGGEGETWLCHVHAISDEYFRWWMGQTFEGSKVGIHFCVRRGDQCRVRTNYRDPLHCDVYRHLPQDSALSLGWLTDAEKTGLTQWLKSTAPPNPDLAPVAGLGAGGAGDPAAVGSGLAGVRGLAAALGTGQPGQPAETPGRANEDAVEEPKQKKKKTGEEAGAGARDRFGEELQEELRARKPPAQASSALRMMTKKKKKKSKKKKKDKKADESSSDSSDESESLFRLAALPTGTERIHRLHEERPGTLANLTLLKFKEVLPNPNPDEPIPGGRHGDEKRSRAPDPIAADRLDVSKRHHASIGHSDPTVQKHRTLPQPRNLGASEPSGADPKRGGGQVVFPTGAQSKSAGAADRDEDEVDPKKAELGATVGGHPVPRGDTSHGGGCRGDEGRQASKQPPRSEREEGQVKRQRTKREVEMVRVGDGVDEFKLGPLMDIMNHSDFQDPHGLKMQEAARAISSNPQIRQYYDEVRTMITKKETLQEALFMFHELVVEYLDRPIDGLIEALRVKFEPLVEDGHPSERRFFGSLGVPQVGAGPGRQPSKGYLVDQYKGVAIRLRTPEWDGGDGGVFVGRSTPSLPGSVLQEDFAADMNEQLVRSSLLWRPLYINNDEVELAREVIDKYNLGVALGTPDVEWQQVWRQGWRRFYGRQGHLTYVGVTLKALLRSRPGSLGNFLRSFSSCALGNFQGPTAELLPVALPNDTSEEKVAFELLMKVTETEEEVDASTWAAIDDACKVAGAASWTWLQLAAINALYLGGGCERTLSHAMKHRSTWTPAQEELVTRTKELSAMWLNGDDEPIVIKAWDEVSQGLEGIYTGPEVKKAYPLTLDAIRPTTPGKGEAARVDLSNVVAPELREYVLDPELLRIPENELIDPKTEAKVHVENDEEWNKVVRHLVEAGMLEREVESETLTYKDKKVRNGAFGVHKGWQQNENGSFTRTLRLIINLIPSNGFQRKTPTRPSQHMGYSPLWGQMALLEDEVVMCYGEDQRHCFHVYRPGEKWRGWFVLNRRAAGWCFNDGRTEDSYPRVRSAPMGWSNIVDFIQSGLESLGSQAGMDLVHSVRMGEALPALPLACPRTYYSWYVDNWDCFKVIARGAEGEYEGKPSDEQLKLREVFKVWDIGRDPKKAAEGTLKWSSLGAEVDGQRGVVGSNMKFRKGVLGATLSLLSSDRVDPAGHELQAIVSKHMHSIQFCRPLGSILDHLYREMSRLGGGRDLSELGRDELILLCCLLPQHWLDQRRLPSGTVYATDASEEGGGACASTGLSDWGQQRCHGLSYAGAGLEGSLADDLLVIEVFSGMGGLKRALELLGMVPQGIISIDNHPQSKKITRMHCRHAIVLEDVNSVTKDTVMEWRRQFPRVGKVLLGGGWPCIHHSSLNVNRQGADGATSQLLDSMLKIRDWLYECSGKQHLPAWTVCEFYENVVMDDRDLEAQSAKIGWYPMFIEAADLGHCRRPRLYWVKNIDLVKAKDLKVQMNGKIRDLATKLTKLEVKTEKPDLRWFLRQGTEKLAAPGEPFFTFTRPIVRKEPPPSPAGLERASEKARRRWRGDGFRLPPYAYEDQNLAKDQAGPRRLQPDEQLKMMGFTSTHLNLKSRMSNDEKGHFIGNGFHAVVVARLLAGLVLDPMHHQEEDLTKQLWTTWKLTEDKACQEHQPWKQRFGVSVQRDQGVVSLRARVSPPANLPLKLKLDPQDRLTDEELLAYQLTRRATQKGCDIRVDLDQPFSYGAFCRHSIDPGNWKWKVLLSYKWKQGGQHINVLETTAALDLARRLARDPKCHGQRSILLVDNMVSLSVLAKGRSSARSLHAPLRRLAAVLLAADLRFYYGWVKSGWNPADGPSRWKARL
eukprot:Skav214671  [mRNA]  locus=scaffold923:459186:464944:+ [translate_table: standard]